MIASGISALTRGSQHAGFSWFLPIFSDEGPWFYAAVSPRMSLSNPEVCPGSPEASVPPTLLQALMESLRFKTALQAAGWQFQISQC